MLTFIYILFFKSLLVSFFLLVVLASCNCRLHKGEGDAKEFWAKDTSFWTGGWVTMRFAASIYQTILKE